MFATGQQSQTGTGTYGPGRTTATPFGTYIICIHGDQLAIKTNLVKRGNDALIPILRPLFDSKTLP